MTNDQRRALEDAVITYGTAKALHARSDVKTRPLAHKALAKAWERFQEALDALEGET